MALPFLKPKEYDKLDEIPTGDIKNKYIDACIVIEGGAFRGVHTSGVLDCLMLNNINCKCVVGVSAGSLNGLNYASGQIGRGARINLKYRNNKNYVGLRTIWKNKGVIGFNFIFGDMEGIETLNLKRLYERRFVCVTTNLEEAKPVYFDKNNINNIFDSVRASSTLPYVSLPVEIEGKHYLDGGCTDRIPYEWAINEGYEKIIVVRTRDKNFRANENIERKYTLSKRLYAKYPEFAVKLSETDKLYNEQIEKLIKLEEERRVFVIYPSEPIDIPMLEKNVDTLGELYKRGYEDCQNILEALKIYLNS